MEVRCLRRSLAKCVDRFNPRRLLEPIGNIPLEELEASYFQSKGQLPMAA
jgi:hypothetical protein